jgi:hypothetical protein
MTFPTTGPVVDGLPSTDAEQAEQSSPGQAAPSLQSRGHAISLGNQRERDAAAAGRRHRLERRGRPTAAYSTQIAERVLDGLADGRTLLDVCDDEGMPTSRTVHSWVSEDREGFAARYHRAREIGCHTIADEILAIADDSRNDWVLRRAEAGQPDGPVEVIFDHEHVRRCRLRIDARRWLLSKILPKTYGDRPDLNAGPVVIDTLAELLKEIDGQTRGLPKDDVRLLLDKTETE